MSDNFNFFSSGKTITLNIFSKAHKKCIKID